MNFHEMDKGQKLQYIWDYYKLPIFGVLLLLYIAGYGIFRYATRTEPILYTALVNVGGSIAEDGTLTTDFLAVKNNSATGEELSDRAGVVLLKNLYLTADITSEQYAYSEASEVKILSMIEAKKLDVVIVNKEAYDAFTKQGFFGETIELTGSPILKGYSSSEPVYAGIIKNTPRLKEAEAYLIYLKTMVSKEGDSHTK